MTLPPPSAPVAEIAAWAARLPLSDEGCATLLSLLDEAAPYHAGRASVETLWVRAWVLRLLARRGLPQAVWPFVLEEIESGQEPLTMVVAASAISAMQPPPIEIGEFLLRALTRMRQRDDRIDPDRFGGGIEDGSGTSAVREILAAVAYCGTFDPSLRDRLTAMAAANNFGLSTELRERMVETARNMKGNLAGSCCASSVQAGSLRIRNGVRLSDNIQVEDQDGGVGSLMQWLTGRPTIIVFFYTRCDNPQKCSLTISRLASLQNLLDERAMTDTVRIAAITYDPGYDNAGRLRAFGLNRNFRFHEGARFFRITTGMDDLRRVLRLGVNYAGDLVNRHRIEVFFTDRNGRVAQSFVRRQWSELEAVDQLARLVGAKNSAWVPIVSYASGLAAALPSLALAFFPKCPVCLAAWLSVVGIGSLPWTVTAEPWLRAVLALTIAVQSIWLWRRARVTGRWLPFLIGVAGVALLVVALAAPGQTTAVAFAGATGVALGSALASRGRVCLTRTRSEFVV